MRKHVAILVAGAALTVTSVASAAPPIKRLVWMKASAAWAIQAKAHGATADCSAYDPSGLHSMTCDFGTLGKVYLYYSRTPCKYPVTVYSPAKRWPHSQAWIDYCAAKWWAKPLPAPWNAT